MRGGKTFPRDGAEATPEQTNPVRTAGPVRGREKPKEIIVGFFNQGDNMAIPWGSLAVVLGPAFVTVVGMMVVMPWVAPPDVVFGVWVPPNHLRDPIMAWTRRRYWRHVLGLAVVAAGAGVSASAELSIALGDGVLLGVLVIGGFLNVAWAHRVLGVAKRDGQWMRGHHEATIAKLVSESTGSPSNILPGIAAGLVAVTVAVGLIRYPALPPGFLFTSRPPGFRITGRIRARWSSSVFSCPRHWGRRC